MSEKPPITFHDPTFDLSPISYVEGYDDPKANVVFVCSNKKAMRVHDYYLKAESQFFREMFEAGTRGGPIGVDEPSTDLTFVLDLVMRKPCETGRNLPTLADLLRFTSVTRKYMFEATSTVLRRLIALRAMECPPRALGFAVSCQPPDRRIARAALENFKDSMTGESLSLFFVHVNFYAKRRPHPFDSASPAADNLQWNYVEQLGFEGYYAYSLALGHGLLEKGKWNWKKVADDFVRRLKLSEEIIF